MRQLSSQQIFTIRKIIEKGRRYKEDHPEIGQMYLEGLFASEIAERIGAVGDEGAIRYSIRGHDGSFNVPAYNGLVDQERLDEARLEHLSRNGKTNGKKGGISAVVNKKGIFKLSQEEVQTRAIDGRKKKGEKIWLDEELKDARELSQNPVFFYSKGPHKGKPNWKMISRVLSQKYHGGEFERNVNSIRNAARGHGYYGKQITQID